MKTCPFCKVPPHYYYIERLDAHRVMCINRKCKIITVSTRNRHTKEEAIADWDERGEVEP